MGQVLIRNLDDALIADYKQAAADRGRSLEAELRDALGAMRPRRAKDSAALLRLAREAQAMTPPDGPDPLTDSTLLIRWDRDTNHGKWIDDGWDDDSGR